MRSAPEILELIANRSAGVQDMSVPLPTDMAGSRANLWTTFEPTGSYELSSSHPCFAGGKPQKKIHTNRWVHMWFANLLMNRPDFRLDCRKRYTEHGTWAPSSKVWTQLMTWCRQISDSSFLGLLALFLLRLSMPFGVQFSPFFFSARRNTLLFEGWSGFLSNNSKVRFWTKMMLANFYSGSRRLFCVKVRAVCFGFADCYQPLFKKWPF